ncbi:TetR/AcrR family transcriptional regulator [Litorivivens sp.]|uniref:TetR/AcrR family transcriptional regulator n=1 Tax=Litorivivens sp. TaxID=2020868 RepID=UPI00356A242A
MVRRRDKAATREAILEAARTVLASDGPDALSLSKVANLADINRGTAYQHLKLVNN